MTDRASAGKRVYHGVMSQRMPPAAGRAGSVLGAARAALLSPVSIGLFTAACYAAAELRRSEAIEPAYGFLRWNLCLAWVPLILAYAISWGASRKAVWPALPVIGAAWLVFLPNAPYLITDLVHLRELVNTPNAITLALLAGTGLLIGVKSVQLVHRAVEQLFGTATGRRTVQAVAVLIAIGVYLGRVLRWNSWTVISHPQALAHAILVSPAEPGRLMLALLGSLVFAVAFYVAYLVLAGPTVDTTRIVHRRQ
jgi:uncharacterized membrane protein